MTEFRSSIGSYASDVGIAAIARGAQVATMNFEIPNDNEINVTTTFAAIAWDDKADNTSFIVNPLTEASQRRYGFKDVTGLKINGVQLGEDNACVDGFNLQFDNSVQTQRCIGSSGPFPGNIIPTTFTPSGSITMSWSKALQLLEVAADRRRAELRVHAEQRRRRLHLPPAGNGS